MATDEHPDYTTSWCVRVCAALCLRAAAGGAADARAPPPTAAPLPLCAPTKRTVHGFLEAAIAGNAKALRMIRAHMNVFTNHSLIPTFLPPDGGNWPWQEPAGPWPPGADNRTASGSGTMTGHTIYLIAQGIIHSTRMALSPVGTQADVDLVRELYGEPWWLQALASRDRTVVGHKLFFSHNYQLTAVEAYMDMYILTGDALYLDAVMGAWEMHRDPERGWILLGGSLAINEGDIYEPGSFHLEAGTNGALASGDAVSPREAARARRGAVRDVDGAGAHGRASAAHAHVHGHGHGDAWAGKFPTGACCGMVTRSQPPDARARPRGSNTSLPPSPRRRVLRRRVLAEAEPAPAPAGPRQRDLCGRD
jgi:hypothetical protein